MNKKNYGLRIVFLILLLIVLFIADVRVGSVSISFSQFFDNIFSKSDATIHAIVWQFRLTKAITCLLAGAALSCAGLMMQTLFRNPLAGPDVLGLSSGSSLAVGAV